MIIPYAITPLYILYKTSVILFYSFRDHIGPKRKRPVSAEEQTCVFSYTPTQALKLLAKVPTQHPTPMLHNPS